MLAYFTEDDEFRAQLKILDGLCDVDSASPSDEDICDIMSEETEQNS